MPDTHALGMKLSCMSEGGIPIQPFIVLGGFLPADLKGFPKNPDYSVADSVVMTFIVDNYDAGLAEKSDFK